jgi:hypothetical protein
MIGRYDGSDNPQTCVDLSPHVSTDPGIDDKVTAYFFDASRLNQWIKKYDLIIPTWFTAGNVYPENFRFESCRNTEKRLDLSKTSNSPTCFSMLVRYRELAEKW